MRSQSRLSVSALAWSDLEEADGFALLNAHAVRGIELLPPRIWKSEWGIEGYRARLTDHGLSPVAFQAIYYGLDGASLLGPEEEFARLLDQTHRVADLADDLGVPLGVFGAPSLRKLPIDSSAIADLGPERLTRLDAALKAYRFNLCIEPLTRNMGCDYLNTCQKVIDALRAIGAQNLFTMLDTARSISAGNDPTTEIRDHQADIAHLHLSEPNLASFDRLSADYTSLGQALDDVANTAVWASIEMLRTGDQWQRDCKQAIAVMQGCF
ncbi:sugar phosphate isomerase/epimerase family protein [Tritonibacter horizontis]|uniref:Xylose isomerase-like TIM barrel n=1 Tax=Tritonibacter horizontis TaxID=1768241 RepID=A0A132C228_9RHOB|nr:TIM barrel protein [Tritonibacter horizontis]KUP94614.1 xylose isomerase-like TIM barrel [Tritonibacter horizontis]